tara:strand:+ start:940 stop:1323 length:384 start_codon:yes stop_codon:yes gene_type:complete
MGKYNPDFDLDLSFGEHYEDALAKILKLGKVEVKTERDIWYSTKNIVIEYEYKGNPSGIKKTKADYWAIILTLEGRIKAIIIFEVKVLRDLLKNLLLEGKLELIKGGDNNDSSMMRVPLRELLINKL